MRTDHDVIRFRFAPEKALAALHMMVERKGRVDLHTALKACYFTDVGHLNKHERPVFGATYKAMRFGPVPLEIYEMAKGEPVWLAELGLDKFPWRLQGFHLVLDTNDRPALDVFSRSDLEAFDAGFEQSAAMTFTERTAATHGPDWQAARFGLMRYEDMIAEGPHKADLVAFLKEVGPRLRL